MMSLSGKTNPELLALQSAIQDDPANWETGGLHIYTKLARKKLDAIAREITHNLAVKRKADGNPVCADGYSGRGSKRRR